MTLEKKAESLGVTASERLKVVEGQALLHGYLERKNKSGLPYTALVSIGSNENAKQNIAAILKIVQLFDAVEISPIYESISSQDAALSYLNLVVKINTNLSMVDLIVVFKKIEVLFGRKKNHKNKAVALDIDVLTFDFFLDAIDSQFSINKMLSEEVPSLPRVKDLAEPYVLCPLAKLCPEVNHPTLLKNYRDLWDEYLRLQGNPLTEVFLDNIFTQ